MDEEFARQFAEHQRSIYGIIRSLCRRPEDADDVFQETVVVLWKKRDKFEAGTNFLAWASTIARFELFAHARKQNRTPLVFDDDLTHQIADQAEATETDQPRLDALRHCMQKLSDKNRMLVEQRYAGGGSVGDIATRLDRSVNSISVTLHSIRKRLLDCIQRRIAGEVE